ncbi:hypothetical protein SESBI_12568 [Sesbania bispinosa]|nr:hypothetical protein SESBI_12568 [Sesbania bispinosa]
MDAQIRDTMLFQVASVEWKTKNNRETGYHIAFSDRAMAHHKDGYYHLILAIGVVVLREKS